MPSYKVHYSNSAKGPPLGDQPTVEADDVDAALVFAERNCPPPLLQPSVGDVHGYFICDGHGTVVVPWRPRGT